MPLPILTPSRAADLLRSASRSALDNARSAGDALRTAVSDRETVAPVEEASAAPGDLTLIPEERCLDLLASRTVGRMAYVARAGVPDIAPVNYRMDGRDVLVRCAPGPKLQAAERGELVAFEVDDVDEQSHTGWSVVVVGRAKRLSEAEADRVAGPTPWTNGVRRHIVRIRPARITGRAIA